jgi:CCR4-NOT transcription complex subunit 7/8
MICKPLPDDETEFHDLVTKFFPSLYDIKFILKHAGAKGSVNNNQPLTQEAQQLISRIAVKSGLQDIAEELNVARIGQAHQAGSDSLLTGQVYFKMLEKMFGGHIDEDKYSGQVWGLNAQLPNSGGGNRDLSTPNMNGATFYSQNGTPSTPQTGAAGIASSGQTHTPQPQSNQLMAGLGGSGGGTLTSSGQFGNFQYGKAVS